MCQDWRSCARAVCCSCAYCGAVLGGALLGAWGKGGGGKGGAASVFKDTNGSGQRAAERGNGQRHVGIYAERRHHGGGGGGGCRPRQKAKKMGRGDEMVMGGVKEKVDSAEGVQRAGRGGTLSPYISEMIIFA